MDPKTTDEDGYTWLLLLNFFVLRWLGLRLARVLEDDKQIGWTWLRRWPREGWTP